MNPWVASLVAGLIGGASLASCASPSRLGDDYGQSVGLAIESQLLAPEAEPSPAPVQGLHGQAVKRAVQVYLRSFDKTEAQQAGSFPSAPTMASTPAPLAGAPPSYTSAATGTSPPSGAKP